MPLIPQEQFQFCGPSWVAASPVLDAQRSINLYPEAEYKSSKTPLALVGRPGLGNEIVILGGMARGLFSYTDPTGPRMFAVGGTHFYEIKSNLSLNDYGAMAGSSGLGPCQAIPNGTQLLVMDSGAKQIYNANPVGPTMTSVFNGVALEYLDGFYLAIATGASLVGVNPNQINASAYEDGTNWLPGVGSTAAYALRTGSADLTVQLAVLNGLLWIFGQKTIEIWYDAGNSPFPLARVSGGLLNIGCLAPFSVAKAPNALLWLGADDRGYARVYMSQGQSAVTVSSPAIENYIANSFTGNSSAIGATLAYVYTEAGHTFYCLLLGCQSNAVTPCPVYDLTTGLWHERTYNGTLPIAFASAPGFSGSGAGNYVADGVSANIYPQGINYASDNGNPITYTRTSPHVSDHNRWIKYPKFALDVDIGTAQPILDYSNDGGRSFLGYNRPLQQAQDDGTAGMFKRFFAWQLGRSRDRVFKVTITDNANLIRIANSYLTANGGTEK
jgi:hypothetical protein